MENLIEREGKREKIRGNIGITVGIPQIEENSDGSFIVLFVETVTKRLEGRFHGDSRGYQTIHNRVDSCPEEFPAGKLDFHEIA